MSFYPKMRQEAGGTKNEQVEISALDPKHSAFCLVALGLLSFWCLVRIPAHGGYFISGNESRFVFVCYQKQLHHIGHKAPWGLCGTCP